MHLYGIHSESEYFANNWMNFNFVDGKGPDKGLGHDLICRNKRNGGVLYKTDPTTSKHRENGPKKIIGEDNCPSWPKYDSGELHKKSLKRRSSPTQARTGHPDVSVDSCGVNGAPSGNNCGLLLIFLCSGENAATVIGIDGTYIP